MKITYLATFFGNSEPDKYSLKIVTLDFEITTRYLVRGGVLLLVATAKLISHFNGIRLSNVPKHLLLVDLHGT